MLNDVRFFDDWIFRQIDVAGCSRALDLVFAVVMQAGTVRIVFPATLLAIYWGRRKVFARSAVLLSAVLFTELFVGGIVKDVIGRSRPGSTSVEKSTGSREAVRRLYGSAQPPFVSSFEQHQKWQTELGLGAAQGPSFPSGHAQVMMAVAVVLGRLFGRRRTLTAAFGIAAISRVYIGAHYPLDVVAGLALGWIVARAVLLLDDHVSALRDAFVNERESQV